MRGLLTLILFVPIIPFSVAAYFAAKRKNHPSR